MAEEKQDQQDKEQEGPSGIKNKLDLSLLAGFILGIALIFVAIFLDGKMAGVMGFMDPISIIVVIGGLFAALIVNFGFKGVIMGFLLTGKGMKRKVYDYETMTETFLAMGKKARKNGLLGLEEDINSMDDPFLKKAFTLSIDGYDRDEIESIMRNEMDSMQDRHMKGHDALEKAGDYAPAWGMIGTLIGLVLMLRNLSDPSTLGPKMAVAMLTTFYGAVIANLFAIPLMAKLQIATDEELFYKEFVLIAVLEIQAGKNSQVIEQKLKSFYKEAKKKAKDKDGEEDNG